MADLEIHPLTAERWSDALELAGERGFYSGCWCMWWRVSSAEFQRGAGAGLRARFEALVADGHEPGLLAYLDRRPVGWVAVAPREEYPRLQRSPKLKPVDDQPVWAVTCFVVHRAHRGTGVATELLHAAVDHARARGAAFVEGFPIDTAGDRRPSPSLYTGTLSMFEQASFVEIRRRGGRPIVRRPTS